MSLINTKVSLMRRIITKHIEHL